jgi:hypothetical protein
MTDGIRPPEEQEYLELFESVPAPATMRRWDRVDLARLSSKRLGRSWAGLSRFDFRGHYLAIAVAAVMSLVVGSAGAAIGLHGRLSGGTAASTAGTPSARSFAAMAYDPVDHVTLLFGGQGSDGKDLADTWAWDGTSWRQVHPSTSPSARMRAQMAWDADRGRMVLFGGEAQGVGPVPQLAIACMPERPCPPLRVGGPLTDTWTWDGSNWRQEHPAHHPGFGFAQGMVDDPGTHKVILVSLAPAELQPGDGSAPAVASPPPAPCSGGQCGVSCSSWSSSGTGGSASGGGCAGSVPPLPTCRATASPKCPPILLPANGSGDAKGVPACEPPTSSQDGVSYECSTDTVTVTATASAGGPATGASSASAVPGALPVRPCFTLNTGETGCGLTTASAAFGWTGSDWTKVDSMQDGANAQLATDPRSGRPLALTQTVHVTCTPSGAAVSSGTRIATPCLECPPNAACAVAGSGSSVSIGAAAVKPPSALPDVCPAVACSNVGITVSLTEWTYDGMWHSSDVSGSLPQAVNAGKNPITEIATDSTDGSVVAIVGSNSNNSAQSWRFDGNQWSLVPGANTPYLVGASIAADPHGLVLFGGQNLGSRQMSQATYTWDGHRWTMHGTVQVSTPTPTATAAVSGPPQFSPASEPKQATSSSTTTVSSSSPTGTTGPATPGASSTPTPTPR